MPDIGGFEDEQMSDFHPDLIDPALQREPAVSVLLLARGATLLKQRSRDPTITPPKRSVLPIPSMPGSLGCPRLIAR